MAQISFFIVHYFLIDAIETACYANLCTFSAARLKFGNDKIVYIIANMSGAITLTILVVVFAYHTYNTFCSKGMKICQHSITERQLENLAVNTYFLTMMLLLTMKNLILLLTLNCLAGPHKILIQCRVLAIKAAVKNQMKPTR